MLLPGTEHDGAVAVAERIRAQLADLALMREEIGTGLTTSIGVVQYRVRYARRAAPTRGRGALSCQGAGEKPCRRGGNLLTEPAGCVPGVGDRNKMRTPGTPMRLLSLLAAAGAAVYFWSAALAGRTADRADARRRDGTTLAAKPASEPAHGAEAPSAPLRAAPGACGRHARTAPASLEPAARGARRGARLRRSDRIAAGAIAFNPFRGLIASDRRRCGRVQTPVPEPSAVAPSTPPTVPAVPARRAPFPATVGAAHVQRRPGAAAPCREARTRRRPTGRGIAGGRAAVAALIDSAPARRSRRRLRPRSARRATSRPSRASASRRLHRRRQARALGRHRSRRRRRLQLRRRQPPAVDAVHGARRGTPAAPTADDDHVEPNPATPAPPLRRSSRRRRHAADDRLPPTPRRRRRRSSLPHPHAGELVPPTPATPADAGACSTGNGGSAVDAGRLLRRRHS